MAKKPETQPELCAACEIDELFAGLVNEPIEEQAKVLLDCWSTRYRDALSIVARLFQATSDLADRAKEAETAPPARKGKAKVIPLAARG